jgi:hypothetical protein
LITITVKVVNYINNGNVATAKLSVSMDNLNTTMKNMDESFQRSKDHIWETLDEHTDKLADHDKQIEVIKTKINYKKGA